MNLVNTFNKYFLSIFKLMIIYLKQFCIAGFLTFAFYTVAWSATYYISPTGLDSNDGISTTKPWATFIRAYSSLTPGDTLILLDGTYHQQLNPTVSGTPAQPIFFRAQNRGKAIIEMTSVGNAILVYSTTSNTRSHLVFDGLIARGNGEAAAIRIASADNVTEQQMTNNITIMNTGAFGSAKLKNIVVIDLGNNIRDSLFEDIWSYGFGRKALQVFGSLRVTVRRAVLRYDYWDGSEYKPNDPRVTFSGYNTQDSIFENIIAIDSAPTPAGRSCDRAAFVASGNNTPALVSSSSRNRYFGLLSLDNYGNGLEVNGGSGDPNEGLVFKDLIFYGSQYYSVNVQGNDNGSSFSYITIANSGLTGFRVATTPSYPITNLSITNSFSYNNNGSGYSYSKEAVINFKDNTAIKNSAGGDIEPTFAPKMNYLVKPETIQTHERGSSMINRYVNGKLTNEPLWPWPNERLIKQQMCNREDLAKLGRVSTNGEGWEPAWCASEKSLSQYIWEYLGNQIPDYIYSGPKITSIRTTN